MYKNIPFMETPKNQKLSLSEILAGKTHTTYDDVVYKDKSYPRFRTVNKDTMFLSDEEQQRINQLAIDLNLLIQSLDLSDRLVTQFKIPKKNGKWRTITAPDGAYKEGLAQVNHWLNKAFPNPSDNSYAYVKGRCIIDAVNRHKDNNWFLKMDLKDFFGSITRASLKKNMLDVYPFPFLPEDQLDIIIDYCTINDVLPQGSSTSPILTNIFMTPLDAEFQKLCNDDNKYNKENLIYTRYADDLLLSCKVKQDNGAKDLIEIVKNLLTMEGLTINDEKTRMGSIAGRNWNLGLMLNKDHHVTVGHRKTRQYKALLHQFLLRYKEGDNTLKFEYPEINGKLAFFKSVEPEYFEYLVKHYEEKLGINYEQIKNTF